MTQYHTDKLGRLLLTGVAALSLTACNAWQRINEVGGSPQLAAIEDPTGRPGYIPVRMPMPAPSVADRSTNSLWQPGARAFFRDQRASRVGDIMTVIIEIDDKAQIKNETDRERDSSESAKLPALLGYQARLGKLLPDGVNPLELVDMTSAGKSGGKGSVNRQEKINLRVAATITQVLPNGNLVLQGKQQVVVNYDLRELSISGVVRPEDVSSENTVKYDQIAEARIAYGGRGQIMDVQQPRYGQQLYDIIFPF